MSNCSFKIFFFFPEPVQLMKIKAKKQKKAEDSKRYLLLLTHCCPLNQQKKPRYRVLKKDK